MGGQPGLPGSQFAGDDALPRKIKDLEQRLQQFSAANVLATAGISATTGGIYVNGFMEFRRDDGTTGVKVDPDTGTFTVFDATGTVPVTRFGELLQTAPGEFGVEVLVGSSWVRLGNQTTTWGTISDKPVTFPPASHTHVGADITSGTVPQADGSQYGWTNNVAGSEMYAVWVGNDGGFHFGRNVSSQRYKENIVSRSVSPANVLALRPVMYDRKPTYRYPEDADGNRLEGPVQKIEGAKNEFGLIAEEVAKTLPEIVTYYDGIIDGVRYDLLGVALIPVVQAQQKQIDKLTAAVRALGGEL